MAYDDLKTLDSPILYSDWNDLVYNMNVRVKNNSISFEKVKNILFNDLPISVNNDTATINFDRLTSNTAQLIYSYDAGVSTLENNMGSLRFKTPNKFYFDEMTNSPNILKGELNYNNITNNNNTFAWAFGSISEANDKKVSNALAIYTKANLTESDVEYGIPLSLSRISTDNTFNNVGIYLKALEYNSDLTSKNEFFYLRPNNPNNTKNIIEIKADQLNNNVPVFTINNNANVPVFYIQDSTKISTNLNSDLLDGYHAINFAKIAESETISGLWTYTTSPIVPNPTTDYQVSNKKYVDDAVNLISNELVISYDNTTDFIPNPSFEIEGNNSTDALYWHQSNCERTNEDSYDGSYSIKSTSAWAELYCYFQPMSTNNNSLIYFYWKDPTNSGKMIHKYYHRYSDNTWVDDYTIHSTNSNWSYNYIHIPASELIDGIKFVFDSSVFIDYIYTTDLFSGVLKVKALNKYDYTELNTNMDNIIITDHLNHSFSLIDGETLTNGSNADNLHKHNSAGIENTAIKNYHIDWGTGTDQISADYIPDGNTNVIITFTQENNFETAYTHSQITSGNPHHVTIDEIGGLPYSYVKEINISDGPSISILGTEHNLDTSNIQISVFEDNSGVYEKIIPETVSINQSNYNVNIVLNNAINGKILLLKTGSEQLTNIYATGVNLNDSGEYWESTNVEDWSQEIGLEHSEKSSSGLIGGGDITDAGGNQVNIASGVGYINYGSVHKRITWSAISNQSMTYNGDNFLWIDEYGNLHIDSSISDFSNKIYLGYVYTYDSNTVIGLINPTSNILNRHSNQVNEWAVKGIGGVVYKGLTIEEGSTALTLKMNSGIGFNGIKKYEFNETTTFIKWYSSSDDGWQYLTYKPNQVCIGYYNDPTKEASVTLTGTVTFTNGSSIVSGSGTNFTGECFVGQFIYFENDGFEYQIPILSIDSDTQITLAQAYQGAGGSGNGIKNEAIRKVNNNNWIKSLVLLTSDGNLHCIISQSQANTESNAIDLSSPNIPSNIAELSSWDLAFIISNSNDTSIANRLWDIRLNMEKIQRYIHKHGNNIISGGMNNLANNSSFTINHDSDINYNRIIAVHYEVSGATGNDTSLDFDLVDESQWIQEDATNGTDFVDGHVELHSTSSSSTSTSADYPFTTSTNYTYDSNKIEVTGGVARLKEDLTNVVSRWHFNDSSGSTAIDDVGSNDLTLVNSPTWITGKLNGGINLDYSSTQYATTGNSSVLDFDRTDTFSFSLWFRSSTTPSSTAWLFCKKEQYSLGNKGYGLFITSGDNKLQFIMDADDSGTNRIRVTGTTNVLDGNWKHIVVTYDGNGGASGVNIYVNGVAESLTINNDNLTSTISNTTNFNINSRDDGTQVSLNADFDEFMSFNKELTSTEIANLYNLGNGTELYNIDLTNSPINCDNEINETSGIVSWDSFIETATKPSGTEVKYVLSDDGGSTYKYWNGASWTTSDESYSQANDASIVNSNIGSFPKSNHRLMVKALLHSDNWSARASLDNINVAYTYGSVSYPTTQPYYVTTGTNSLSVSGYSTINSVSITTTEPPDTDIKWLISFDGRTTWKYFVPANNSYDWDYNTPSDYTYNSTEILVNNGVASIVEDESDLVSRWHLNEGSGTTVSDDIGSNNGTLVNNPTWTTGKLNGALQFDASSNQHVNCGNDSSLALSDNFTVEAWVYPIDVTTNYQGVVTRLQSGTYDGYGIVFNSGKFAFAVFNDSTSQITYTYADSTATANQWYHVVAKIEGGITSIYINGVKQAQHKTVTAGTLSKNFELGSFYSGGALYFTGVIDEVNVYNVPLSDDEVAFKYNNGNGREGTFYKIGTFDILSNNGLTETVSISSWNNFTETSTKGSTDEVKYILSDDDGTTWYYWNGSAWTVSDGTYSQSNTASEVDTNIGSFPKSNKKILIKAFLHNSDRTSTPILDNVNISYSLVSSAWKTATNGLDDLQTLGMSTSYVNGLNSNDWSATGGFESGTTTTMDFAMDLKTTNSSNTPEVTQITVNYTGTGYWQQAINGEFEIKLYNTSTVIKNISGSTKNVKVNILLKG